MLGIGMPGMMEWIIILVIVLIFFGAGKLPDVMGQFGKGIKAFKDGANGDDETSRDEARNEGRAPRKALPADELDDPASSARSRDRDRQA